MRNHQHHSGLSIPSIRILRLLRWLLFAAAGCSASTALACDDWLAKTVAATGAVERRATDGDWQPLQVDQTVCPGDSVRVGASSRAALYLRNNTFMRLGENSAVHFPAPKDEAGFWLEVSAGLAHFISRIVNRFEVSTPYVNAVVEGTEFVVGATPAQASVAVLEGKVKTWNDAGTESVTSGQQVQASSRSGALTRLNVASASTVEWAIHYPPVLTLQNLHAQDAAEQARLNELAAFLQQNRPDLALQTLEQNQQPSPTLAMARAALLLHVARVDDFDAQIAALLQGPQAGSAHALKAVADAARNRSEPALASARKAVALEPQQAAGYLALSWAQQAALQLDDALASAKKAAKLEPQNTLAWLRVSELHLMQGDTGAAQKALAKVEENSADSAALQAQVQSARGFVNLFRLQIKTARANFEDALQLDSTDPQHHLGLGLALLRDGKLEDGRRQLEYAVSLDPLRSTLRSYLGRAYFEEKRDHEAIKQWELAKQFDPNDPTPYFYTGVHKLFANDPVGAIDELETSKTLNDKRAIYRSETLLQSDAASRSATLARAYNEVGYDQGVLLNGWDAIRRDPTSAEGHRLLADHYLGDSRYEAARASELLQSQLWQPLSAYPLQPQLSESGIAVVEGSGPQRPGFNEFHPLFTQDGIYGMANGYAGSDNTWGDDLVGSVMAGPLALSLGQYHFESDGWRENADQEQDIYSGFVQWDVSPSTSVQLELRKLMWDFGDLAPELAGLISTAERQQLDRMTYRIGVRHRFNSATALIGNVLKQDSDFLQNDEFGGLETDSSESSDGKVAEVQFVTVFNGYRVRAGAGYSNLERGVSSLSFDSFVDPDDQSLMDVYSDQSLLRLDPDQRNAYLYVDGKLAKTVDVAAGLSYVDLRWTQDFHREETFDVFDLDGTLLFSVPLDDSASVADRSDGYWLPKLGVGFRAADDLYLRAAAFQTLSRFLVASQTIEPVTFMGFAQVFDDLDGVKADNGAVGLDYRYSKKGWFSYSYISRWLDYPHVDLASGFVSDLEYLEYISDAQFVYAPSHKVSYYLRYQQDARKYGKDDSLLAAMDLVGRRKGTLGVEMFGGYGTSLGVDCAYYNQVFRVNHQSSTEEDSEWVADLYVRKKLENRVGVLELGVKNMLDVRDEFVRYDASVLEFYPSRFWYAAVSLNL